MSNNLDTITNKMWTLTNELRGNMKMGNEFKTQILVVLFYRYLSENQEKHLVTNNLIDVQENQTINDAYKEQVISGKLSEYLEKIIQELGYAISPEDTWASLNEKINSNDMKLSDYQRVFGNWNINNTLTQIFDVININNQYLDTASLSRVDALNKVVKLVDGMEYKNEESHDDFGKIFEYLLEHFASSGGKTGSESYTPKQVSNLLAKLVTKDVSDKTNSFTVYDPTMGSGTLLLTVRDEILSSGSVKETKLYGQDINTSTYNLARMNLMVHDVPFNDIVLNCGNSLENDWPTCGNASEKAEPQKFDAVVANPPYSIRWNNSDEKLNDPRFGEYGKLPPASKGDLAFALEGIYHLNESGTMAIVLPHGALFRGAAEGEIRKKIIEKNYLDAVIGLPANVFYATSIPTVVLIFKKNRKTQDILFIDASNEFEKVKKQNVLTDTNIEKIIETIDKRQNVKKYAHVAPIEEVMKNDFNLSIPRYVDTFEVEEQFDIVEVSIQLEKDNQEIERLQVAIEAQLELLGKIK